MNAALRIALRAGIRTLAQSLAGGLAALGVATVAEFAAVPEMAVVLGYSSLIAALAAFLMNFAENLPDEG